LLPICERDAVASIMCFRATRANRRGIQDRRGSGNAPCPPSVKPHRSHPVLPKLEAH
jgi:hypothetical protein